MPTKVHDRKSRKKHGSTAPASGDVAGKNKSGKKKSRTGPGSSAPMVMPSVPTVEAARDEPSTVFAVPAGVPAEWDSAGTAGPQDKHEAKKAMAALAERLAALQDRLFAQAQGGAPQKVLLVLQGMDTAGKDGVIKHVIGLVNPAGVKLVSFKKPSAAELAHDFLWRIENGVPPAGFIGVFNRSQYEDVLIVRVHDLVDKSVWSKRYAAINEFERRLVRQHTTVLKCFLHISRDTQRERLAARLDDDTKYWKYNPADLSERARWADYQDAYADVLRRCSTVPAPWFVIPSDRKWYRNWAVAALLTEALERVDPRYPPADFDVAAEKEKVALS